MVSGSFWVVSAGFRSFQMVSGSFMWFQVVSRFSKYAFLYNFDETVFTNENSNQEKKSTFFQMLHCAKFYIDFYNINLYSFTLAAAGELNVNDSRIWAHKRREFWFTDIWNNLGLHEIRWKDDFRMTRPMFEYIVHLVRPFIIKRDSVAITLLRLATGNCHCSIAKSFAVAKSMAVEILQMYYRDDF